MKFLAMLIIALGCLVTLFAQTEDADTQTWTRNFQLQEGELSSAGRNPFFILEPGYRMVLENGRERLTITVLNETRKIDKVETRIVEERETKNGLPVEVSRNFFAISGQMAKGQPHLQFDRITVTEAPAEDAKHCRSPKLN